MKNNSSALVNNRQVRFYQSHTDFFTESVWDKALSHQTGWFRVNIPLFDINYIYLLDLNSLKIRQAAQESASH